MVVIGVCRLIAQRIGRRQQIVGVIVIDEGGLLTDQRVITRKIAVLVIGIGLGELLTVELNAVEISGISRVAEPDGDNDLGIIAVSNRA